MATQTETSSTRLMFELVSPERLVAHREADMVVVPGTEGLFGVLRGHTPVIATLQPGVIDVYEGGKVVDRMFVGGGFADVTADKCVILAELAMPLGELDRKAINDRIQNLANVAEIALGGAADGESHIVQELALQRAMLQALDSKPL
jgi:F-type H+-transporting ATPase subunit epsilon